MRAHSHPIPGLAMRALSLLVAVAATAQSPPEATPPIPPIETAAPDEQVVTLVTGEVIRGVIVESSAAEVVLSHAILGRLVVPRSSIASIASIASPVPTASAASSSGSPKAHSPTPLQGPAEDEVEPPDPSGEASPEPSVGAPNGAAPAAPRRAIDPPKPAWASGRVDLLETDESMPAPGTVEWLANIQLALAGVRSDTDQLDLRAAGALTRLTHTDRWTSSFEYFLSILDGDTTDNNLLVTSVYDYFFLPTDWLAFGKLQYQYDQFQSWEHRLSGYAGLGYRLFHAKPFALTLKGGFGATREFGDPRQTIPEAYAEVAMAWWIDRRQTLEASVNIAPDLTNLGDYRILARLDWIVRFDERGMAFVGGIRDEYQSSVPAGSTNNDLRYYLGVRYDF